MSKINLEKTFLFGSRLIEVISRPLYLSFIVVNEDKDVLQCFHGWAGGLQGAQALGSYYATAKHVELVETIRPDDDEVVLTPVPGYPFGKHYMGGVRRRWNDLYIITACSGWKQRADTLMALVLNYALTAEFLRLHHIGYRYQSDADLQAALRFFEVSQRLERKSHTYGDYSSYYFEYPDTLPPHFRYSVEHEHDPDKRPGIHWDFLSDGGLVNFVATHMGEEPSMTLADVFGEVGAMDEDAYLSIMERDSPTAHGRF